MFCPQCGANNADTAWNCVRCGAALQAGGRPAPGGQPGASPTPPPPPAQPPGSVPPPAPGVQYPGYAPYVPNIPTHLVFAIIMVICCWPFAIPAIVQASKVKGLLAVGDIAGATAASRSAKKWCIIALVFGIIGNTVGIGLQILVAAMESSSSHYYHY